MRKTCFKCGGEKDLSEFYRHSMMADGRLNKCKDCTKLDVRNNRSDKAEYYREYDRRRGNRQSADYQFEYRAKYPKKTSARRKVAYHIRNGNLVRKPCEICGSMENVHAHHDDYDQPLNVRWLCALHHHEWHSENGEGANPF